MEYKVEFDDGLHPNVFAYAVQNGRMYGCDAQICCKALEGGSIRTTINKKYIESPIEPTQEQWDFVYKGLKKQGTNCILAENRKGIDKALEDHVESFQDNFGFAVSRIHQLMKDPNQ